MKCSVELQSVRRLPAHADGQPKTAFLLVVLAITAVLVAFKPSLMAMVALVVRGRSVDICRALIWLSGLDHVLAAGGTF